MTIRRVLLNVCLFLLLVSLSFTVSYRFFPYPLPYHVERKLRFFEEHKDEYDLVFVGSSYVYHQIDPILFDAQLQERGYKVKSFNFGLGGALGFENTAIVEKILALKPRRLRYVVMGFRGWPMEMNKLHVRTRRTVWWHTLGITSATCERILRSGEPWERRVELLSAHLHHMWLRYSRVGLGFQMARSAWSAEDPPITEIKTALAQQGYFPVVGRAKGYETLLKRVKQYNNTLTAMRNSKGDETPFYSSPELRLQMEVVLDAGVELIYVISPQPDLMTRRRTESMRQAVPTLFAFNEPDRYPYLYTLEARSDTTHLNLLGARAYTKHLAERFARYLASAGSR